MKTYIVNDYKLNKEEIKRFLFLSLHDMKDGDVFVAVTRKGYWLYKSLCKDSEFGHFFERKKCLFFSDRYVMKDFNFDCIKGRRVYIFDDTINHGNKLFFYFALFEIKGAECVIPMAYAAGTEFFLKMYEVKSDIKRDYGKIQEYERAARDLILSQAEKETKAQACIIDFVNKLRYEKIYTSDQISRFSIEETLLFQDELVPLVMDLPMFRYMKTENNQTSAIYIKKAAFVRLCEKTVRWNYVESGYDLKGRHLTGGFFQLNDNILFEKFQNVFFDFVVKCKYNETDDKVAVVFTPFAVIRSGTFSDVWKCFCILYADTAYYSKVKQCIRQDLQVTECERELSIDECIKVMKKNHNLSRAIFRAVIYQLSMYIGFLFKEKVYAETGIELECDFDIMKDHNVDSFNATIKEQWAAYNRTDFEKKLFSMTLAEPVEPINVQWGDDRVKCLADEKQIYLYIHERIIKTKRGEVDRKEKLLTIESLESELEQRFRFVSEQQKRRYMTKALLFMLEYSCISNEVLVDDESGNIYRGFRAGENSEILFEDSMKWVYPFVYALYNRISEQGFIEYVRSYFERVEIYFEEEGYFKTIIDKFAFQMYKNYYNNCTQLNEQIQNKAYLLDDYRNKKADEGLTVFIEEAFLFADNWLMKQEVVYV